MASKWRVNVALDEETYDTLKRLAAVEERSMSSIVRQMITELEPGLRRVMLLGEAWQTATEEQRVAMARAVHELDAELGAPIAQAVERFSAQLDAARPPASALARPPLGNTGVRIP